MANQTAGPASVPPPANDRDVELGEVRTYTRSLSGPLGWVVLGLGVPIALVHIYFNVVALWPQLLQNAVHFAGFAVMCALIYPVSTRAAARRPNLTLAIDLAIGLAAAFCALYLVLSEERVFAQGQVLNTFDQICAVLLIVVAIEFTRRTTGWVIPIIIVVSLSYIWWLGPLLGGVFQFRGLSLEAVLFRNVFNDEGMFGIIARISSTFVFMFILFGAFLIRSGAGDFIVDLGRALAGRLVGGPGLVAVFASALTGTISGSAVANTASTGVITIPLMKRSGFPRPFAGAVEAAASTGGQLMPPIMGAGAFVMATYTQIPYTTIVAVSILPAILYFLTVGFFVRIEAKRHKIGGIEGEPVPRLIDVLKKGGPVFLLPLGALVGMLVAGFTPTFAAGYAILAVIAASWLTSKPMGPKAIVEALSLGARNMVMTAILLVTVGIIVNSIATSGVGNMFSLLVTEWSGGNLLIAMVLVALASLVLGMGLPVTAAYIVLVTLSAPALQQLIAEAQLLEALIDGTVPQAAQATFMLVNPEALSLLAAPMDPAAARSLLDGLPPDILPIVQEQVLSAEVLTLALLSAHLIIFWLSQDSNVTPPVCLTAFTAAAIAGSRPMATGFQSWKIAKGLYLVPLLFAYTNFIGGPIIDILQIFLFAVFGLYAFSAALQGYLESPIGWGTRAVLLLSAGALLWPSGLLIHLPGLAAFLTVFVLSRRRAAVIRL